MRLRVTIALLFGLSPILMSTQAQSAARVDGDDDTIFKLKSDRYMMTIDASHGDHADERTESNIVQVTVTDDGTVKIVKKDQMIEGRLDKNRFTASTQLGKGTLQFTGELTGDHKLSGNISGTAGDGKTSVKGTFKLKHLPR